MALTAAVIAVPAFAEEPPVFSDGGHAIKGYDPVAYFDEGKPVRGSNDFTAMWNGTVWRFKNANNRELFLSDPEKFAPQYGGYCAWAVSQGYIAPIDPDAWTLHDGKLYLNFSRRIRRRWSRDIPGNIKLADNNWPDVLQSN